MYLSPTTPRQPTRRSGRILGFGRFLEADPLGYEDSPNLYAYALNDPVNFSDPLGTQVVAEITPCTGNCTGGTIEAVITPEGTTDFIISGRRGSSEGLTDYQMYKMMAWGQATLLIGRAYNYLDAYTAGRLAEISMRCPASDRSRAEAARDVIGTVQTGLDVAEVGAAATGVGTVVTAGLTVTDLFLEGVLLGFNVSEAASTGEWGYVGAQLSSAPARLIPGGRWLQSGLRNARGSTGVLRNARGQFRTSRINNPGVVAAGNVGTQQAADAAANAGFCG